MLNKKIECKIIKEIAETTYFTGFYFLDIMLKEIKLNGKKNLIYLLTDENKEKAEIAKVLLKYHDVIFDIDNLGDKIWNRVQDKKIDVLAKLNNMTRDQQLEMINIVK